MTPRSSLGATANSEKMARDRMAKDLAHGKRDSAVAADGIGMQAYERLPHVLFVSVNPFSSTSNNGKTFASFFEGYPSDSIAQLYFHREIPSSPVCARYFRITDEALLKDVIRPWRITGERVSATSPSRTPIPPSIHTALKGSQTARLIRQVLWTGVRLENRELLAWLDDFGPEIVFFCGSDSVSLYRKVTALANRYGAKMVFYVTDDYVLPTRSRNISAKAIRSWTRREFRRLTSRAELVLTIGDGMSSRYEREYGIVSVPVMNMVPVPQAQPAPRHRPNPQEPFTLLYAGSLHSNRWKVLARIVERLPQLDERGISIRMKIFGPELSAEMRPSLDLFPYVEHGGLLSPSDLKSAISEADALLYVEADDPASMEVTALSVSTKIPEYLVSGRSILAIGPRGIAAIDYLWSKSAAIVVEPSDTDGLDEALSSIALDPMLARDLTERAFALARANHDGPRTRSMLWGRLKGLLR